MDEGLAAQTVSILLVEDNKADAFFVEAALKQVGVPHVVKTIINGSDAMKQLERFAAGLDGPPDLVILDINLPGMNGREILARLVEKQILLDLPICVFTSAGFEEDIVSEYKPLRLCFEAKTSDFKELQAAMKRLVVFCGKATLA